ncbi:MAG: hypothetical protein JXL97_01550 [Bacteroidales bacterium]|nr:hypothetical protein [Bacteroidales bacterium]
MNILSKYFLLFVMLLFSSCFFFQEVTYLTPDDNIKKAKIQPQEALNIAQPFIEEHATYLWKDKSQLKTHIVMCGKYYYIMQTDYPAKTTRYYMQPAVRINSKNGEYKFIERK